MKFKFEIPDMPKRGRAHRILFETDSPFRTRTVQNKQLYKRNSKHRQNGDNNES